MISLDAMPIPLANNRGCAWVDKRHHELLSEISWSLLTPNGPMSKTVYAVGRLKGQSDKILMHRLIAALDGIGGTIDHIDRNGLNNTRANLRTATRSQNQFNRSMHSNNATGFVGIHHDARNARYSASIRVDKKTKYLGSFGDPEAAARVRDMWAKEAYGEFAVLNFPGGF